MEAIVFSAWLLVFMPRDANAVPMVYLEDLASEAACEQAKVALLPEVQRKGFRCIEVKKVK